MTTNIFEAYADSHADGVNRYINGLSQVLLAYAQNKIGDDTEVLQTLFSEFITQSRNYEQLSQDHSIGLNIFKMLGVSEVLHSYLISDLLDPFGRHGQKRLFLDLFLHRLKIGSSVTDNWIVTAETGRIDILIRRQSPPTVIIIENKSNGAIDQPNQLYRYWYQQVYNIEGEDAYKNPSNKIIYLAPDDWKTPAPDSLLKPKRWRNNLPDRVTIEPMIWNYRKEVVEWLEEACTKINANNTRMLQFLNQYIEYWKQ